MKENLKIVGQISVSQITKKYPEPERQNNDEILKFSEPEHWTEHQNIEKKKRKWINKETKNR